jgi:exopolyphosphatase/guanosine-5'-triphosphate,3'-diphosphate pyrophosphatase
VTRVAVVDLGTNSTRLLVADVEGGVAHEVERQITITKLGERVDGGRLLVPGAIERVHRCLEGYADALDRHRPVFTLAYATSAVRDAENSDAFLSGIEERFGLPTRLLTGAEEAVLTFRGVMAGRELDGPTAIVDIGGGSTEIVLADTDGIRFHTSLDFGCIRLTERFVGSDPPGLCDIEALVLYVRSQLMATVPADPLPGRAIGTAGTVTGLGALHLDLEDEDPALLHGHVLPASWIAEEAHRLAATPIAALARRRGIAEGRAPVIAAGALALAEIVSFFELDELEISEADILHGVALETAAAG